MKFSAGIRPMGLVVVLPLLASLVACGTTVPLESRAGSPALAGDGLSLEPGTGPGGGPTDGGAFVNGPQAGQGDGATRAPAGSGGTTRTPSSIQPLPSGGVAGAPGRGVTKDRINIGIMYVDPSAGQAAGAIGASGADTGNGRAVAEALIADINKRRINGRKLNPSWYSNDVTSNRSQGEQMQIACDSFIQDHKSFAMVGLGHPALAECGEKHGAVTTDATFGVVGLDRAGLARLPHLTNVSAMAVDRAAEALVPALSAQGWFGSWNTATGAAGVAPVRVGVISYDDPYFRRAVERELKPALASAGHPAIVTEYVNHHQSLSDLSGQTAQVQSAVLKFASQRVTHVVNFDDNGTIGLFLMNAAESQGYRPRYGVTSGSEAQYLLQSGSAPAAQLQGALGIGWHTILDVPYRNWLTDKHSSPSRRRCGQVLSRAGIQAQSVFAATLAAGLCDALFTLELVMGKAGATLNRDSYRTALSVLGGGYQSAATPGTDITLDRRDGATRYFFWGFDARCGCMTYRGRPRPAP